MIYKRLYTIEEINKFYGEIPFNIQRYKDSKGSYAITANRDDNGKDAVVITGEGDMGEYSHEEEKAYTLGELDKFDLYITEGITSIAPNAFSGLKGLEHIFISKTVEDIGENAFKDCESLESVVICEGLKHIDKAAFEGCESLKYLELPSTLETIEDNVFYGCGDMTVKINKTEGSLTGAPWKADDTKIVWKSYNNDDFDIKKEADMLKSAFARLFKLLDQADEQTRKEAATEVLTALDETIEIMKKKRT